MKQLVKSICPNFDKIVEAEIFNTKNKSIGWFSTALLTDGKPIGGGTAATKSKARRIALAELCERMLVKKIMGSDKAESFLCNEFPSTCGFAFGFEDEATKYRAMAEAAERWIWSKWIDEGFFLHKYVLDTNELSCLGRYYASHFEKIHSYSMSLYLQYDGKLIPIHIGIVLGEKNSGIFPGSRVASPDEDVWEHALLEAYRHLQIFEKRHESYFGNNIVYKRIEFFGNNKNEALSQVNRNMRTDWDFPKLRLLKKYDFSSRDGHLWRALCYDYISWTEGEMTRFVY